MKILLDECLPIKLRTLLSMHDVYSTEYMGWSGYKDSELLKLSEQNEFDVFLTADQHIREHNAIPHNLTVLIIPTNKINLITQISPQIQETLTTVQKGNYYTLALPSEKNSWCKSRFVSETKEENTITRTYNSAKNSPSGTSS